MIIVEIWDHRYKTHNLMSIFKNKKYLGDISGWKDDNWINYVTYNFGWFIITKKLEGFENCCFLS